jgi:hypothetical protein
MNPTGQHCHRTDHTHFVHQCVMFMLRVHPHILKPRSMVDNIGQGRGQAQEGCLQFMSLTRHYLIDHCCQDVSE